MLDSGGNGRYSAGVDEAEAERQAWGRMLREANLREGVSQSFISDLEGGRRTKASTDTAVALARALGVTVDELLREEPAGDRTAPGGGRIMNPGCGSTHPGPTVRIVELLRLRDARPLGVCCKKGLGERMFPMI